MSNTFSGFDTTIISEAALEAFADTLMPLRVFATSLSGDAAKKGTEIEVLWLPEQSGAQEFNGEYVMQDANASAFKVPIDKHDYVSWSLTDVEASKYGRINLEMFGKAKGQQLAEKVLSRLWSQITAANYGAPIYEGPVDGFMSDQVIDLSTACDNAKWRNSGRAMILSNDLYGELLKDPGIKDASQYGSANAIREGKILSISKFNQIYASNLIPANGEKLMGFAVLPEALMVAMRYLEPLEGHDYHAAFPMTDPDSGFTFGFRQWYDNNTGTAKCVIEAVYGSKKGNGAALKRIVKE